MKKTKINAEGGEVVQLPDGRSFNLKGPSHSNGGINLSLPDGSVVFSDQLKIGNKTVAERKKNRDKTISSLKERLNKTKDPFLKNTAERTINNLAQEEIKDIFIQQNANDNNGSISAAEGAVVDPTKSKGMGLTDVAGILSTGIGIIGNLFSQGKAADGYGKEMPNFFKDYGTESLNKLRAMEEDLRTEKTTAGNELDRKLRADKQTIAAQIGTSGADINVQRALRTSSKMAADAAQANGLLGLERIFQEKNQALGVEQANLLEKMDEKKSLGAAEAFEYNEALADNYRMNKDAETANLLKSIMGIPTLIGKIGENKQAMESQEMMKGMINSMKEGVGTLNPMGMPSSAGVNVNAVESTATTTTTGGETGLLGLIHKTESGGNYDALYKGVSPSRYGFNKKPTEMQVSEVLQMQKAMREDKWLQKGNKIPSSPVGGGQIVGTTLQGLVDKGVLKLTDKFSIDNQRKAINYLGNNIINDPSLSRAEKIQRLRSTWTGLRKVSDNDMFSVIGG